MRPEPFKTWTRPYRLKRKLSRFLPSGDGARRLRIQFGFGEWRSVQLARQDRLLTLTTGPREAFGDARCFYYYKTFLPVLVAVAARCSIERSIAGVIGDGASEPSDAMTFSANYADALLVPDPDFFNSGGYARQRAMSLSGKLWNDRDDEIVWRGATTGEAMSDTDHGLSATTQRVSFCYALKDAPGVDAKIYRVSEPLHPLDAKVLQHDGLMGGAVPEESWLQRRFAFDIDGNTNAWSNLFVRLLFGCCVLKVASPSGYTQWYYDRLVPGEHFVPVRADLADLHDQIAWCRAHPQACRDIAAAAQSLAQTMTLDHEMQLTVARIDTRRWRA